MAKNEFQFGCHITSFPLLGYADGIASLLKKISDWLEFGEWSYRVVNGIAVTVHFIMFWMDLRFDFTNLIIQVMFLDVLLWAIIWITWQIASVASLDWIIQNINSSCMKIP